MTRTHHAPALTAALIAATLAACAPASTHGVHHVPNSAVPFGLMSSNDSGTASTTPRGPATQIYLLRGNRLTAVSRRVVGTNVPAEAVQSLLAGPTAADTARNFASAIPRNTNLLSLDVSAGIATVDLSTEFGALGGDQQTEAVAQIVYTVTASLYIDAVTFAINGVAIEVPDGTGSLSSTPKRRSDYPGVAPR